MVDTMSLSAHNPLLKLPEPHRPHLMQSKSCPLPDACPVCGDKVSGYHYGLLTCESCKGFFKRTVQNKKNYSCSGDSRCPVDKSCRKRCPHCRFAKCIYVGMKVEAVREDRMRGGRNKFGSMYKRDRAQRMQRFRSHTGMGHLFSSEHVTSTSHDGLQQSMINYQHKIKYDQNLQSPTLSSSTHSPNEPTSTTNGHYGSLGTVLPAPAFNYTPQCDSHANLAALLSTGMHDDHLLRSQSLLKHESYLKSEPYFDSLEPHPHYPPPPLPDYSAFGLSDQTYAPMTSLTAIESGSSNGSSPVLPVCPVPTSKAFELNLSTSRGPPKLLEELANSLPGDFELQNRLYGQLPLLKGDPFFIACHAIDSDLFRQINWAKNAYFFKDLDVEDQMAVLQTCWAELHVLDYTYHTLRAGLPDRIQLQQPEGKMFDLATVALLGLTDQRIRWSDLSNQLYALGFDRYDYAAMKYLILLEPEQPKLRSKKEVALAREQIHRTWFEYRQELVAPGDSGHLLAFLSAIRSLGRSGEEFLYFKHMANKLPQNTLLAEMLTSGANSRKKAKADDC